MEDQANTKRLLSIGESAEYLGISIDTLRRWEKKGRIAPLRSPGGHRYYSKEILDSLFGKRYTRDEETIRRTGAELGQFGQTTPDSISDSNNPPPFAESTDTNSGALNTLHLPVTPNPTFSPEPVTGINQPVPAQTPTDTIPSGYNQLQTDQANSLPELQAVKQIDSPLEKIAEVQQPVTPIAENSPKPSVETVIQVTELQTSVTKQSTDPTNTDTIPTTPSVNDFSLPNILLPVKENSNRLTEEEIERRIHTIITKEKKKTNSNLFLAITTMVFLLIDIALLYIWFTSSRISSPIP